jgi:hypothetical protein
MLLEMVLSEFPDAGPRTDTLLRQIGSRADLSGAETAIICCSVVAPPMTLPTSIFFCAFLLKTKAVCTRVAAGVVHIGLSDAERMPSQPVHNGQVPVRQSKSQSIATQCQRQDSMFTQRGFGGLTAIMKMVKPPLKVSKE